MQSLAASRWPALALGVLLALTMSLTGCVGTGPDDAEGSDAESDGNDGEPTVRVDGVTVTSFPETASPGTPVTVCWHVDGEGTAPHVALHWDTESHDDANASFTDYLHVVYPDNASRPADAGYALPGDFCAAFDAPATSAETFYKAHAMVDAPGLVSEEHTTRVSVT